mgnify:CR=1 FL=1
MINHKASIGIIIIILFIQISSQTKDLEKLSTDIQLCMQQKDTTSCSSVNLYSGYYQCCKLSSLIAGYSYSACSVQMTPITEFKRFMEMASTKAIYKESFGFSKYNLAYSQGLNPDSIKMRMTYDCADGQLITEFGYDTYTQEEIDILQSEEHCLDYTYGYRLFSSKQECYDSLLLPSSVEAGLSCGYYKYSIKYSDGSTYELESCGIFNKDSISQQNLDEQSKNSFKSFVDSNKDGDKIVLSYEVSLSNKEGQYLVYDSALDRISSSSTSNMSRNLTLSYLLYIILILLV